MKQVKFHHYPFYSPRFWHGMRPGSWWNLLRHGRFRIHPSRLLMVVAISFATPFNTFLAMIQAVIFRRNLAVAELHGPPVFIVGHWRSGTTLLHELMVRDERLSSPSTFQCFAPCHFLVTEWFFRRFQPCIGAHLAIGLLSRLEKPSTPWSLGKRIISSQ